MKVQLGAVWHFSLAVRDSAITRLHGLPLALRITPGQKILGLARFAAGSQDLVIGDAFEGTRVPPRGTLPHLSWSRGAARGNLLTYAITLKKKTLLLDSRVFCSRLAREAGRIVKAMEN